jgi:hypothetical protein
MLCPIVFNHFRPPSLFTGDFHMFTCVLITWYFLTYFYNIVFVFYLLCVPSLSPSFPLSPFPSLLPSSSFPPFIFCPYFSPLQIWKCYCLIFQSPQIWLCNRVVWRLCHPGFLIVQVWGGAWEFAFVMKFPNDVWCCSWCCLTLEQSLFQSRGMLALVDQDTFENI